MRPSRCLSILLVFLARCGEDVTQLATDWDPQVLAIDSTGVYWATSSVVKTASLHGGPSKIIASMTTPDPSDHPVGLAFDGSALYYGTCGAIMRLRFFDQASADIAVTINECVRILATNGESIFWANFGDSLYQAPKSGGDSVSIFVGSPVSCIVADGSNVYWTASGSIMGQRLGGSPVLLGPVPDTSSCNMTLDSNYIYWVSEADDKVIRIHRSGDGQDVLASGQQHLNDVTVDDASIYWTASGKIDIQLEDFVGGAIWRMPKDLSRAPGRIVSQRDPHGLVLTEKYIYWSTWPHQQEGGVFARPK